MIQFQESIWMDRQKDEQALFRGPFQLLRGVQNDSFAPYRNFLENWVLLQFCLMMVLYHHTKFAKKVVQ